MRAIVRVRPHDARIRQRAAPRRSETAHARRGDLPRGSAPAARLPAGLWSAGNAAVGRWVQQCGAGRPLDPHTRAEMETAFGADFQAVRIPDDERAAATTQALGATAITHNADIHLGRSAPDTGTAAGKELLAHELAHVVQQAQAGSSRNGHLNSPADTFEAEADRAAGAVVAGDPARVGGSGAPPAIQRQTKGAASKTVSVEEVVAAFLDREWAAQSGRTEALHITPEVQEWL